MLNDLDGKLTGTSSAGERPLIIEFTQKISNYFLCIVSEMSKSFWNMIFLLLCVTVVLWSHDIREREVVESSGLKILLFTKQKSH